MMDQWVLGILGSASVFLCLIGLLLVPVYGNTEGDALNALKTTLADPNNVLQSWDPTLVNPCTWFHVTCNSENSVTRVDLGNANLSGQLVPQLGQLSNLQYLELYSNNINGRIPYELGNLTNLVSLDLYLNKLVGPIPDTLGKLQKLRFLRLNNNSLTGQIPMLLTTVTSLQVLDLSNNNLTGPIPVNGSFSLFTPISFANNPLDTLPATPPPPISPTPTSPVARDKRIREVQVFIFHKTLISSRKHKSGESLTMRAHSFIFHYFCMLALLSHISNVFAGKSSPMTVGDGHNNVWFSWIIGRRHNFKRH